jgi:thiamine-monophosphate kinase
MKSEFELIARYFDRADYDSQTIMGVGDDAALITPTPGRELAITTDTLISGVHFPEQTPPYSIAYKALAVNLSDLAAMGASPRWFTLAISLPHYDKGWLEAFSSGLFSLASRYRVALIGGDTTRGPLSITIQAMGELPSGQGLLRSGARAGDDLYVSGSIGAAGLALKNLQAGNLEITPEEGDLLNECLNQPEPRVELGIRLREIVNSCIDVSDGLLADLQHVLDSSRLGAKIEQSSLPYIDAVKRWCDKQENYLAPATWGDDYELLFSAPESRRSEIDGFAEALELPLTRIGTLVTDPGIRIFTPGGEVVNVTASGYDHFRD